MIKVNNIREAFDYLKEGELLTSNGKDQFILRKQKVIRSFEGNMFSLSIDDFIDIYSNTTFYLYEDVQVVDEEKDEAYYRYYKK